jgi:hypothetical protein
MRTYNKGRGAQSLQRSHWDEKLGIGMKKNMPCKLITKAGYQSFILNIRTG